MAKRYSANQVQSVVDEAVRAEWAKEDTSDATLILSEIIAGRMRWEPFHGLKTEGELCWGGMRYSSKLDATGCPALSDNLRRMILSR